MKSLSSKIINSIVLAVVVYLLLTVWGSRHGLGDAFSHFNWWYFPLLLVLAFSNYLIRFLKWQYYLRTLSINIPVKDSFIIHMSGLGLSISPGKLGEVVKSYFLKKAFNQPISVTAPIVLADRLTDMVALVILASIGAFGFVYGRNIVLIVALVILLLFLAIIIRPVGSLILGILGKLPLLKNHTEKLQAFYDSSHSLLQPKRILFPLLISIIAWSFEAIGFYFVFVSFGIPGFLAPFFIYSFSTIVGAVSMLPGGLGATEGAIAGLMHLLNIDIGISALATLIIRLATLWFAVILGLIFLIIAERKYGSKTQN